MVAMGQAAERDAFDPVTGPLRYGRAVYCATVWGCALGGGGSFGSEKGDSDNGYAWCGISTEMYTLPRSA